MVTNRVESGVLLYGLRKSEGDKSIEPGIQRENHR